MAREKLTKKDIEKIEAEIEHRRLVIRPEAIEAVKEARAQGDLSENFEYYAAKKYKNQNDSRIRYLENMLKNAITVEDSSEEGQVGMNDEVTILYEDEGESETFKLVTSIRENSLEDRISIESPIGRAVLHHREGERVLVKVSSDYSYYVKILSVKKSDAEEEEIRGF